MTRTVVVVDRLSGITPYYLGMQQMSLRRLISLLADCGSDTYADYRHCQRFEVRDVPFDYVPPLGVLVIDEVDGVARVWKDRNGL